MNNRMPFWLLALLTTVGTLTISSAYAQVACPNCELDDPRVIAQQLLLKNVPISVWTDSSEYKHNDVISVEGRVANVVSGVPVTLTVTNSLNSVITVAQLPVDEMGSFGTTLNTQGKLWKYDGTYYIKATYGSAGKSNRILVDLVGMESTTPVKSGQCAKSELSVEGNCVPYSITGGVVTGVEVNTDDNSLIVRISSTDDGTLTISPSKKVLDGVFMVLVDGEEWDDSEINGNQITVMFPAGTEEIEIIGTSVVPEFGAIAALILAVAIISVIAVSAKSRLSIMPRY